jgi:hypothetical protein
MIGGYFQSKLLPAGLAFGLAASAFTGCIDRRIEYSDVLKENAVVSDTVYTPSHHGSSVDVGITTDFDGNAGLSFTPTSVSIPEKYGVVFRCQHGKFVVQGAGERYRELWEGFEEGQEVEVTYKEVYRSVYDDADGDGVKELVERELIKYDFLGAKLKLDEVDD